MCRKVIVLGMFLFATSICQAVLPGGYYERETVVTLSEGGDNGGEIISWGGSDSGLSINVKAEAEIDDATMESKSDEASITKTVTVVTTWTWNDEGDPNNTPYGGILSVHVESGWLTGSETSGSLWDVLGRQSGGSMGSASSSVSLDYVSMSCDCWSEVYWASEGYGGWDGSPDNDDDYWFSGSDCTSSHPWNSHFAEVDGEWEGGDTEYETISAGTSSFSKSFSGTAYASSCVCGWNQNGTASSQADASGSWSCVFAPNE